MKSQVLPPNSSISLSFPKGVDPTIWKHLVPILQALKRAHGQIGRFRFYGYLEAVYRTYTDWRSLGIANRSARALAECLKLHRQTRTSPIRVLIDATFPALDAKQKSRWSRALEFAASKKTKPNRLRRFLRNYSGISGCARRATKRMPKKQTFRNDWT